MYHLKSEFQTEGHYQSFSPIEKLKPFIFEYWTLNLHQTANHQKGELEQPKIYPEIIFKFGVDYEEVYQDSNTKKIHSKSNLSGVTNYAKASKRTQLDENLLLVGVKFNPLGMFHLLQTPLYKFQNQCISLDDIGLPFLKKIEEKLFDAQNFQQLIYILNQSFQNYFSQIKSDSEAIHFYKKVGQINSYQLNDWKKNESINYKSLERKFKKYIGTTPKKFLKMKRFAAFYQDWISSSQYKYVDLVYKHGYYDQNHLIKEFKSIFNTSPNKFLKSMDANFTQNIMHANL